MDHWIEIVKMVEEFYKAFEQEKYLQAEKMTEDRIELREKLFEEEKVEYEKAKKENNRVEMLDAICDMYYIKIGTLLEEKQGDVSKVAFLIFLNEDEEIEDLWHKEIEDGFDEILPEAFAEVHKSNMSKLDENGKAIFREDGKILKGPNFFEPNLKQFLERTERNINE